VVTSTTVRTHIDLRRRSIPARRFLDDPIEVERFDDLVGHHVQADIELRAVPNLWPLRDLAVEGPWDCGVVRSQQARARPA
jgi:hypothetical protein